MPDLYLLQLPITISDTVAAFFELNHFSGTYYWATKEQWQQIETYTGCPVETVAHRCAGQYWLNSAVVIDEEALLKKLY